MSQLPTEIRRLHVSQRFEFWVKKVSQPLVLQVTLSVETIYDR